MVGRDLFAVGLPGKKNVSLFGQTSGLTYPTVTRLSEGRADGPTSGGEGATTGELLGRKMISGSLFALCAEHDLDLTTLDAKRDYQRMTSPQRLPGQRDASYSRAHRRTLWSRQSIKTIIINTLYRIYAMHFRPCFHKAGDSPSNDIILPQSTTLYCQQM